MKGLIGSALDQRVAILLAALLLLFGGGDVASGMRQEEMPSIDFPFVIVTTAYPGATPEDVSRDVTGPLERSLRNIHGLKNLYSTSVANLSAITLEFDLDTTAREDEANVRQVLDRVTLPDGAQAPQVSNVGFSQAPILQVSLFAPEGTSAEDFRARVRDDVIPQLQAVAGVGRVDARGLDDPSIQIVLDKEKMGRYGLRQAAVVQALQANNVNFPAGTTTGPDGKELNVRVEGGLASLEDLRDLPIPLIPASPQAAYSAQPVSPLPQGALPALPTVRLGDIATVTLGAPAPTSYTRYNGHPAVALDIVKDRDANADRTARDALAEIRTLAGSDGFKYEVLYNASESIRASVTGMEREVGLGAVFAALIIYLFLRRWRATLVAAVAIPVSLAIAILVLAREGITLNIMTLGGMAVAAGRVVDDAIVVTENVFRRSRSDGYTRQTIVEGAAEVGSAITASTVTTVAVFAPLGLVGGLVGKVFQPFALTVVFALLASLLVAVTVVPALTYLLHRRHDPTESAGHPTAGTGQATAADAVPTVTRWQRRYQGWLSWFLNHKLITGIVAVAVFAGALGLAGRLGTSFLPADTIDTITVHATFPMGTPLPDMDSRARDAERLLLGRPEVTRVQTAVGASQGPEGFGMQQAANDTTFLVAVKKGADAGRVAGSLQDQLAPVLKPARVSAAAFSPVTGSNSIQLVFSGPDEAVLEKAATQVEDRIRGIDGLANLTDTLRERSPVVEVVVDPAAAAEYGLSTAQALGAVHEALSDQEAGTFDVAGHGYPVLVRTGEAPDLDAVKGLTLHGIQDVRLDQVAKVRRVEQPTAVNHRNLQPYVAIRADVTAENVGAVTSAVARAVDAVRLPAGVSAQDVGATQTIQEGFTQMARAIAVAVAIVYLVMLVAFGEALAPLAILASLPFAAVGAIAALYLAGYAFSIPAMIGLLMLIGIVVTNAIVLMDRFQRQRRAGLPVREALLEAASTRLRPILMTALATMFALLPLALGLGEGSLISATLAWVVIGGLVTSTALTLVVVPMAYEVLHTLVTWPARRRAARTAGA